MFLQFEPGTFATAFQKAYCGNFPTSELRLSTDKSLTGDTNVRATHRLDIHRDYCVCGECGVRNTLGTLVTKNGRRPNLVLTHVKLVEGRVLQKYYEVSTYARDAAVPEMPVKTNGRWGKAKTAKSSTYGKILSLEIWDKEKTFLDDLVDVNTIMDPSNLKNAERFSFWFFASSATICGVFVSFAVGIVYAFIVASRPEGGWAFLSAHVVYYLCTRCLSP